MPMSRRCSHCGHNGHNSRTCVEMKGPGGFKLFGVRLSTDSPSSSSSPFAVAAAVDGFSSTSMRKSFSMGNLSNYYVQEGEASPPSPTPQEQPDMADTVDGYASDDLVHTNSNSRERKKGVPWTEEEHRNFLIGLQKLGKGDWRGISRNFVKTRTPTQVASHAQKYFLRRNNLNKRRRRSSLFDITPDTVSSFIGEPLLEETNDPDACPELSLGQNIPHGRGMDTSMFSQCSYPIGGFSLPMQRMHLPPIPVLEEAGETVEPQDAGNDEMAEVAENDVDVMESVPEVSDDTERGVDQLTLQFPLMPMWPGPALYAPKPDIWNADSKLVRPTPIIPKPPAKASDTENASEGTRPVMEPSPLSYKLLEEHSRHSAFHTTSTTSGNREIDGQGSLGNAISVP